MPQPAASSAFAVPLSAPRAVIFDWDNTLVDTWPIIHAALNHTFETSGLPLWTMEQTQSNVRRSMRDSFPEVFGPDWEKAASLYQQHYQSNHLENLTPLPGSVEVLEYLRAASIPSLVVSNKRGHNLRKEVEHLGWNPYFSAIIGADDAAKDKPHPDPVHMAMESLGFPAGPDIWFVGDSEVDLACAVATGCIPILYGEIARQHAEYTSTHFQGAPYHSHALTHNQLIDLINKSIIR